MQKLRELVKGEQIVRRKRMDNFCSADFNMHNAGLLFPSSWSQAFEVEQQNGKPAAQIEMLHPRMDFVAETGALREALQSAIPIFDDCTEDGMRFRIYKMGGVQVRTTQEHG